MKLSDHVDQLRNLIEKSFDKQLLRLGIHANEEKNTAIENEVRQRFDEMLESYKGETGDYKNARAKLLDELTFTLFNRIAALKVMEAAHLFPPIITKQAEQGDRSFGHKAWLEIRPDMRDAELEGIRDYIEQAFNDLGATLPLYSNAFPYALLPDAISLNDIIDRFNAVENDPQVETQLWQSDDILGWLYESYNNAKKQAFKDSGDKTEYDKVSLQSQVYTPRWVVQFLVENSLGKLYLEMYPNSDIARRYKIANAPKTAVHNDTSPSVCGGTSPSVCGDTSPSVCGDTSPSVCGDTSPSVCGDTSPSVRGDASPSVRGDASPSVRGDASPSVRGDASPSVRGDASPSVRGELVEPHPSTSSGRTVGNERTPKPLHEIKLIDPASGSGNFLLYAFDFFYALYLDQIENYGADYDEADIPQLIIEHNLHGIDLDDRAIQLAQLGLYIKARKKRRTLGLLKFNVVSSDFFLPDYQKVQPIFEQGLSLDRTERQLIADIWTDLQFAYKFGSLIRLDEKLKAKLTALEAEQNPVQAELFGSGERKPVQLGLELFTAADDIEHQKKFIKTFFSNLKIAVAQYAKGRESSFLANKTGDAITFLELLTTEYDVATANPPYTDSSNFGKELKSFIDGNYQTPFKFHINLYATFIKRCYEFVGDGGLIAMLHPLTFMYIKSFEDVRKFILEKTHINLLAELGLGGIFEDVQVDACMYVLKKGSESENGVYFDLKAYKNHTNKPNIFSEIYTNFLNRIEDKHIFSIPQSKLKIIKSFPFIYWISDEFRTKFGVKNFGTYFDAGGGLTSANNDRFLRFWWEVSSHTISQEINDAKKWRFYVKGGTFNKWFGNIWIVVNWENSGQEIRTFCDVKGKLRATLRSEKFYFKEGVTYAKAGSKGASFRYMPSNTIIDSGSPGIFIRDYKSLNYGIAFLNSKLASYILGCLNPTVSTQVGDIERIPFVIPEKIKEKTVDNFAGIAVQIKKRLCNFSIVEPNYLISPIQLITASSEIKTRIKSFFNYENHLLTQVLINEAIINEKIFDIYELTPTDKAMVLAKEGDSIGGLPVCAEARAAYLNYSVRGELVEPRPSTLRQAQGERESWRTEVVEFPLANIQDFIHALPVKAFTTEEREKVEAEFLTLYQGNNNLEEFCIRHAINPINVWYWFSLSNVIPKQRMNALAMEFLADLIREILMSDEDGIIPLVANAGGKVLLARIEEKFIEKGFSMAQYASFDSVLGRPLNDYLNKQFFAALSDHLKLFKQLPATPFIWHLSSGQEQGFDCYIIIYKWSRDKLLRLRSVTIEHRERALINRQTDLANNDSADAQNEKDKIFKQLKEIEAFKTNIDELLSEGYNPQLDDGVGKNIAPLQKRKMIPYDVLNAGQLKKYLNADW
ncbi:MAG: N-6 DNA methylase [Methylococcales bacterium]|nr:N-6 DNA methylase [Methylococcales bacterium]